MHAKQFRKIYVSAILAALYIFGSVGSSVADIGTELWQKTYNTTYQSFYFGAFEAVDFLDSGTLLAAGHGDGALAARYDADDGTILDSPPEWIRYDTGNDYFYAQLVDSDGTIYLAGRKSVFAPGLWKYDSSAALQSGWPKVHSGTGNGRYLGAAMDSSGNIYSVGYQGNDWILNKHDKTTGAVASGFPKSFNSNGFDDAASAVATDSNDDFIVVGWVGVTGGSYDWYVRKYASDGSLSWETSYDLKGNTEAAIKVAVDSEDNIIVCGYRNNGTDESSGMDRDWYIVKYAKDGDGSGGADVLWEQAWNSGSGTRSRVARALLIDSSDNFYVAGDEDNSAGAARPFLQYRDGRTGALLNSQELSHPETIRGTAGTAGTEHDYITDLALDGDRLVISGYVWEGYLNYGRTGFLTMLELTPAIGTEEWNSIYNEQDSPNKTLFLDVGFLPDGKVMAVGDNPWDTAFGIRYNDSDGTIITPPTEWVSQSNGNGVQYRGQHVDDSGNIFFVGKEAGYAKVWKYGADGTLTWEATGAGSMVNNYNIAVDSSGNSYTAGIQGSWSSTDTWNGVLHKFNSDGSAAGAPFPIVFDYDGSVDGFFGVAVDSKDNAIVTGSVKDSTTGFEDAVIQKYDSNGTLLWQRIYDAGSLRDSFRRVTVDSDDNILIAAYKNMGTDDATGIKWDWVIAKYDPDGTLLWGKTWDDGTDRDGYAREIAVDEFDNLYVIGEQKNSDGMGRVYIQYRDGRTGALLKSQELSHVQTHNNSPATESDQEVSIKLQDGKLAVSGYVYDTALPTTYTHTGFVYLLDTTTTYNVTTGSSDSDCSDGECNLQAALDAAENNLGMNTVLRLQQGTYSGNFTYEPATGNNGNLSILGGYSADFSSRTLDPTNTILDGGNTGTVLLLRPGTTAVNGSLKVEGVTVRNGAGVIGGGLLALTTSPGMIDITNNIITDNLAEDTGGGCAAAVWDFSSPNGGDIYFSDNIVRNNTVLKAGATDGNGGGCSFIVTGETILANNLVYGNSVGDTATYTTPDGGGLDFDLQAGEVILTNNTVVDNEVFSNGGTASGGGISLDTSAAAWGATTVELNNSIIYNNQVSTSIGNDIHNRVIAAGSTAGSALSIANCDYNDLYNSTDAGTIIPVPIDSIDADPQFSSAAASLYSLISGSACIDSGDNNAMDMPVTDLAGETRPQDGDGDGTATSNMGCYESIVYAITAAVGSGGSLDDSTPSPQSVVPGETATFIFNADSNYHVASVSNCGINYTNTDNSVSTYTATTDGATANCEVSAVFAINRYTATANAGANGNVDGLKTVSKTEDSGTNVSFTFWADSSSYHVTSISGCGFNYINTDNSIDSYAIAWDLTEDCSVSGTFAIDQYTVTATAGVNGGLDSATSSPQTVDYGLTTQFKFNAETGYHVATINGCGISYTNAQNSVVTYTVTTDAVTADCAVNATFAVNQYSVVSSVSGGNGTIDPFGSQTVVYGATPSFDLDFINGYHVDQVSGTCGGVLSGTTFTTNPVTADCTVIASFTDQYTLNLVFGGKGSGTVISTPAGINCTGDCSADFMDGTSVTLSAVAADNNSEFMGWSGDVGDVCPDTDPCTVTMDQARQITATFKGGFPWPMFLPAITGAGTP